MLNHETRTIWEKVAPLWLQLQNVFPVKQTPWGPSEKKPRLTSSILAASLRLALSWLTTQASLHYSDFTSLKFPRNCPLGKTRQKLRYFLGTRNPDYDVHFSAKDVISGLSGDSQPVISFLLFFLRIYTWFLTALQYLFALWLKYSDV